MPKYPRPRQFEEVTVDTIGHVLVLVWELAIRKCADSLVRSSGYEDVKI
jgi:hypothetical protein